MAKLSLLAGFGAGYVLGAKAGRSRYEQIRRAWDHAKAKESLRRLAAGQMLVNLDRTDFWQCALVIP